VTVQLRNFPSENGVRSLQIPETLPYVTHLAVELSKVKLAVNDLLCCHTYGTSNFLGLDRLLV
jgi:hypothetical protein